MADVELPQLGESVTEGVITDWLVAVGDSVDVDQPLVEISTDKVDTEIPSPVAGTVKELKAEVDDTVEVGDVIVVIDEGGDDGASDDGGAEEGDEAEAEPAPAEDGAKDEADDDGAQDQPQEASSGTASGGRSPDVSEGRGVLTSPLVRSMLRDAGLSPADVSATGEGGRITREDAERAIEAGGEARDEPRGDEGDTGVDTATGGDREGASRPREPQSAAQVTPPPTVVAGAGQQGVPDRPTEGTKQIAFGGDRERTEDLSRVRKAIAKGMKNSMDTTAQLTAVVEIDMTAVMNLRAAVKDQFKAREGVSLSPLPFICRAVTMTLPRHPALNSSIDTAAGTQTFHRFINLGIAVDTERGLLVPNVKDAQDLTISGIASRIGDIARRTRGKGLKPDEISGGTFTITNTGSLGTLIDTPILNAPEVAILGAAAIEKRPVVVSDGYGDSIAIRWMSYLCLSYDHQALDGADAARFLQDLKWVLEHHDFRGELGL